MISGTTCLASTSINTELLRSQLDQLHSEAHSTHRKSNNARFRLLRLSEAAESLRRQATKNVRMGKEDDARELLRQKKKIMLALEKSKGRVDLLDELAAKLNEAISIKEAQLVQNVVSDLEIAGNDVASPVRIISPVPGEENLSEENNAVNFNSADIEEDHGVVESMSNGERGTITSSIKGISAFVDFFEDLDRELEKIEKDMMSISGQSTLVLNYVGRPKNSSEKQLSEILENVRDTRLRIHSFVQKIVATS